MPLSRSIARANRAGLNKVTRHLVPWLPGFGLLEHVGRKSGKAYTTPINIFRNGDGYAIALTYGKGDWVHNVLAAGGCAVTTRRHRVELTHPRLVHDETRSYLPWVPRKITGLIHANDFVLLDTVAPAGSTDQEAGEPS